MTEQFEILSDDMHRIVDVESAKLQLLANGFKFVEGPAWWPEVGGLIFSDIPADTIHLWRSEQSGPGSEIFRQPSRKANGNTIDRQGRLITCEHGSRTVTRTSADGRQMTLASSYNGHRLNSPNDVVVQSDGTIWFTDPPYGIKPELREQPANYVFRLDAAEVEALGQTASTSSSPLVEPVIVAEDFSRPNGLCFSPDEKFLYIADSDTEIHHIRRFEVLADHTLRGGEVFCTIDTGVPDGIRCDTQGRLYSTAADGVQVFDTDGRRLGRILTPQTAANCTFGGQDGQWLFITATSAVHGIHLKVPGADLRRQ